MRLLLILTASFCQSFPYFWDAGNSISWNTNTNNQKEHWGRFVETLIFVAVIPFFRYMCTVYINNSPQYLTAKKIIINLRYGIIVTLEFTLVLLQCKRKCNNSFIFPSEKGHRTTNLWYHITTEMWKDGEQSLHMTSEGSRSSTCDMSNMIFFYDLKGGLFFRKKIL